MIIVVQHILEGLQKFVVEHKCNLGIAYDGDGDRCLAVDEKGELK